MIKAKIFSGKINTGAATTAFNEWSKNHPDAKLISSEFEMCDGVQAICILYEEEEQRPSAYLS